jgi:hypothetical protein
LIEEDWEESSNNGGPIRSHRKYKQPAYSGWTDLGATAMPQEGVDASLLLLAAA